MENKQDETENKLDKVDSYLTKFGTILKKHWGKLLLILFAYCAYWMAANVIAPAVKESEVIQEEVQDYPLDDTTYYYDSTYVEE